MSSENTRHQAIVYPDLEIITYGDIFTITNYESEVLETYYFFFPYPGITAYY